MTATATTITQVEAEQRAALLAVDSYRIALDLSEAPEGARDGGAGGFESTTTVEFTCTQPGAGSWIDVLAEEIHSAQLNGVTLAADAWDGARLRLTDLAAANTLVVRARFGYSTTGEGLNRAVDPADGLVYLYTQCAAAEARRVFACFEQPDLKATFTLDLVAPADWTVLATSPTPEAEPAGEGLARWVFAPTPRLSTYLAAFCAGPFHGERGTAEVSAGELPLGVYVRRSLAEHLDAEEILDVTRRGLAHFEAMFGIPYPFAKYDQVFVPEFTFGAMEHPGVVTFNEDHFVFRTPVTVSAHEQRAVVILHEMAHMWFGDLVTMRWWDDLWLNESFADWAGNAAAVECTWFTDAWVSFAQARKAWAYQADQQPSTHPIAGDVPDLEAMYANFDGITYAKGASSLRQLVAYVGRPAFDAGVAAHLAGHAWGNATLADLLDALSKSSGRDLGSWARVWLQEAGVTSAQVQTEVGADGRYVRAVIAQEPAERPDGVSQALRPMRIAVGVYAREGSALVRRARTEVDLPGASADLPELVGLPAGDLVLVNDDDLSYVKGRLDTRSLAVALSSEGVGTLAEPLPRALVWGMLWEAVRDAELPAQEYVRAATVNLGQETLPRIVETVLRQAQLAVDRYVHPGLRASCARVLSDGIQAQLDAAEPGSDRQRSFALAFAASASGAPALERLDDLRAGRATLPGLPLDQEILWALVHRLATTGLLDGDAVEAHRQGDRTSRGEQAAARALAARPEAVAKADAWAAVLEPSSTPSSVLAAIVSGFNDPSTPAGLLDAYITPYAERVPALFERQTPMKARSLAAGLFPPASPAALAMAGRLLADPDLHPGLRRVVAEARAEGELTLRCRARSQATGD